MNRWSDNMGKKRWYDRCQRNNGKKKVSHTLAQAKAAMLNQKGKELEMYFCDSCGAYHLTRSRDSKTMYETEYSYNILGGIIDG